jgi:PAS domain S-box-containing protein
LSQAWKLLAIIVSFLFFLGYFLQKAIDTSTFYMTESHEQTLELLSELFSVFVAMSIFSITWYAYNKSRNNHSLFLGAAFFTSGILILFHLLSYPFMPDFLNLNSENKASNFFILSRFFLAIFLLASVYIHKYSLPRLINKKAMGLSIIALLSVLLASVLFQVSLLYIKFNINSSNNINIVLSIITIILLVVAYLYTKRAKETGDNNLLYLSYGSIIILFSNLVYFYYEFSGHFLIICGFFCFFLSLYKSSVELPYEKLAIAEEKLKSDAEERFRIIFDNALDGILIPEIETKKFYMVNNTMCKMLGFDKEELMNMSAMDIHPKKDLPNIMNQFEKQARKEIELIRDIPVQRKDGSIFYADINSTPITINGKIYMLGIFRDVTERKLASEAIQNSEKNLKDAQSLAHIGSWQWIIATDTVKWSEELYHINGLNPNSSAPSYAKMSSCYTPQSWKQLSAAVEKALKTGEPYELDLDMVRPNGTMVYTSVLGKPYYDASGKIAGLHGTVQDITERRLAEEKINKSLLEKEVLLREIHHRVKNNMQIVSSLMNLQTQTIEDKKYKDIFIESQNRIHTMAIIHEKLYRSDNLAQINFKEYIEEIVTNIFSSYRLNTNIKIDINVKNIPINMDTAVPCGLIINELITNSLKYAFPEGRPGKIQISVDSKENNMIQLLISDDGIGIPKEIDIRNTRTLGLTLITALAENQLSGELILNREKGTEFQISFRGTK